MDYITVPLCWIYHSYGQDSYDYDFTGHFQLSIEIRSLMIHRGLINIIVHLNRI